MVVLTELMKPRILVADDDDGLRQLLRLIVSREGFEVIEADSGEQALMSIRTESLESFAGQLAACMDAQWSS